jgi:hypothetical protein
MAFADSVTFRRPVVCNESRICFNPDFETPVFNSSPVFMVLAGGPAEEASVLERFFGGIVVAPDEGHETALRAKP